MQDGGTARAPKVTKIECQPKLSASSAPAIGPRAGTKASMELNRL